MASRQVKLGHWPIGGWWTMVQNWKGHPRYVFIGWWFAYNRSVCGEVDGYDEGADVRSFRVRRWEWKYARPMGRWARRWNRFFSRRAYRPHPRSYAS